MPNPFGEEEPEKPKKTRKPAAKKDSCQETGCKENHGKDIGFKDDRKENGG